MRAYQASVYHEKLKDRQDQAHAHQAVFSPCSGWVLSCDLGCDAVFVYGFDNVKGALVGAAHDPRHLRVPLGSGPRHLEFHPSDKWVYITCELSGEVATATWDKATGVLCLTSSVNAMPEGVTCSRAGHRGNADLHCSADGRFVYTSTRA